MLALELQASHLHRCRSGQISVRLTLRVVGLASPQVVLDTFPQEFEVGSDGRARRSQGCPDPRGSILVQSVEGRALSVLMNVEAGNGLLAWRTLVDTYEPRIGGRWTLMLMGIIGPQWSSITEESFLETLEAWEVMIRRYGEQSGEEVTGATRCAVVMRHVEEGPAMASSLVALLAEGQVLHLGGFRLAQVLLVLGGQQGQVASSHEAPRSPFLLLAVEGPQAPVRLRVDERWPPIARARHGFGWLAPPRGLTSGAGLHPGLLLLGPPWLGRGLRYHVAE